MLLCTVIQQLEDKNMLNQNYLDNNVQFNDLINDLISAKEKGSKQRANSEKHKPG